MKILRCFFLFNALIGNVFMSNPAAGQEKFNKPQTIQVSVQLAGTVYSKKQEGKELEAYYQQWSGGGKNLPLPFPVNLRVSNVSENELSFVVMSCSYDSHWKSNNVNIHIEGENLECRKNIPTVITLMPQETYEKKGSLVVREACRDGILQFRIGFTPIKPENPEFIYPKVSEDEFKNLLNETYWSEEIEIKIIP